MSMMLSTLLYYICIHNFTPVHLLSLSIAFFNFCFNSKISQMYLINKKVWNFSALVLEFPFNYSWRINHCQYLFILSYCWLWHIYVSLYIRFDLHMVILIILHMVDIISWFCTPIVVYIYGYFTHMVILCIFHGDVHIFTIQFMVVIFTSILQIVVPHFAGVRSFLVLISNNILIMQRNL